MDGVDKILAQWRRERPDLDIAAMGLIGRLRRVSAQLVREMEKTFATFGLTDAGFDVLATLRRSGAPYRLSPSALLGTMMITSGTMTNRIDQLEKAGLVARTRNPDDGRSFDITLTPKGLTVIDAAVAAHVKTQAKLIAGLPKKDIAALDTLLRKFSTTLEAE